MSAHILVTGGAGFIGSHLVELLLAEGCRVTVVDDFSTGALTNLPVHPALQVLSKPVLEVSAAELPGDLQAVAHLAASASVQRTWDLPLEMHHRNLTSVLQVLEWCRDRAIPRLCFASSAAVYGNPVALPITEGHPTAPISPYGLQKLTAEHYGRLFAERWGLALVALRLFNVYGPRQSPASDYAGVISRFVHTAREGGALTIYGTGQQTRDFIYVRDVARAFWHALQAPVRPGQSLVCNIAGGRGVSLGALAQQVQACYPTAPQKLEYAPGRAGDIEQSVADPSRAQALLNFEATWSLAEGLAEYVRHSHPH